MKYFLPQSTMISCNFIKNSTSRIYPHCLASKGEYVYNSHDYFIIEFDWLNYLQILWWFHTLINL